MDRLCPWLLHIDNLIEISGRFETYQNESREDKRSSKSHRLVPKKYSFCRKYLGPRHGDDTKEFGPFIDKESDFEIICWWKLDIGSKTRRDNAQDFIKTLEPAQGLQKNTKIQENEFHNEFHRFEQVSSDLIFYIEVIWSDYFRLLNWSLWNWH